MRKVTYSMAVSLDGFVVGPDGNFNWMLPDEEVFGITTDEVRGLDFHLLGRRLYEAMLYWENVDQSEALEFSTREFASTWRAIPKVVFSTTLTSVEGNARLASGSLAEEIARLRAEPGDGHISIGGATLAAEAARLDLIDEYRIRFLPILVGGGLPYFPHEEREVRLNLLEARPLASGVVYTRHEVVR